MRTQSAAQRPKPAMTQQNAAKSAATAQKLALTLLAAETARKLSKDSVPEIAQGFPENPEVEQI